MNQNGRPTLYVQVAQSYCGSVVGISRGRKCCDLVNASYLWLADRTNDAFTRSPHLRLLDIPTPGVLLCKFGTFGYVLALLHKMHVKCDSEMSCGDGTESFEANADNNSIYKTILTYLSIRPTSDVLG